MKHAMSQKNSTQEPGADVTSTKEADFLDQDAPIRGQNFAVVSFVSPEDILKSKDVFSVGVFLKSVAGDLDTLLTGLSERFGDDLNAQGSMRSIRERYSYLWSVEGMQAEFVAFRKGNEARLNSEFSAEEGSFRTSVRGLKIRGVYENEAEARNRIKVVQQKDPLFDVYMMEVGCWCPWSPNPEDVRDSEYNETQLNTLVKKYKENSGEKDMMYESRKREMIDRLGEENDIWQERNAAAALVEAAKASVTESTVNVSVEASTAEASVDESTARASVDDSTPSSDV